MKEILVTSSVLIVALLLLRLIFGRKVSRGLIYSAWALVALRLLLPVQIGQMHFSVLTAAKPLTQTVAEASELRIIGQNQRDAEISVTQSYIEQDRSVFTPEVLEYIEQYEASGSSAEELAAALVKTQGSTLYVPQMQEQVAQQVQAQTKFVSLGQVARGGWLCGAGVMALWFGLVNVRHGYILRKNRKRLETDGGLPVYVSETVETPCLAGLFRPVIYLTPECAADETVRHHVLTHELTHYRHGDHIWALVRCVCLCIYWFDPLVWVAAFFSRRDCELACDAGAIKRLGEQERLAYGKSLVDVVSQAGSPARLLHTATSMSESKEQLKERVNFIVKKPKISLIAAVCMVLIVAIVTGCAAAGPTDGNAESMQGPTTASRPSGTTNTTGSTGTTDPEPTEPEPTEPEPTDPVPTDPQPTEPIPTDPQPTDPLPSIGNADTALYDRAIAALDAYGNGQRAYYYDESGEYYDQNALWKICELLIRLEDYGDSAKHLQYFWVEDLLTEENWKCATGNSESSYQTIINNCFAYNAEGKMAERYGVEEYDHLWFTAGKYLEFFYTDAGLEYYTVSMEEDWICATVTLIYGNQGQVVEKRVTGDFEFTVFYTYDDQGNIKGWQYSACGITKEMEYICDGNGRLIQTNLSSYVADALFPDQMKLRETQVADYIYDDSGFLQSVSTDIFGWNDDGKYNVIHETVTYTYDDQGRLLSQYRKVGAIEDLEGNVLDDITRYWEEVTYTYETFIFYTP